VPRGRGRHGTSVQVLADRLSYQCGSIAARHGSVEFRTKFVVERYGNADSHIGDTTDDNANSRITDPIGESPCHEDRREWY